MKVIYVDDERPALDNFRLTTENFAEIDELNIFQDANEAFEFAESNPVDVAFLDMEMHGIHGLDLAKKLKQKTANIRIIFVTAYSRYALDAWQVDAMGYLLKPYTAADIHKELAKCAYKPMPSHRVSILTIPRLSVTVNGETLHIPGTKTREMMALLVDRGPEGFTTGEGIACLWPDRVNNAGTQSLLRMTYKRLLSVLEEAGIGDIIASAENRRFIRTEKVECDLYRILEGDKQTARNYNGRYLEEYSWAEERNSQLHWLLMRHEQN